MGPFCFGFFHMQNQETFIFKHEKTPFDHTKKSD
jgi:hypothetical protein